MDSLNHRRIAGAAIAALLQTAAASAYAANFDLSGNLDFHNSVVQINFTLASAAAEVKIWSDSWQSGLNFDPTAAVWARSGNDFSLLQAVDDDNTVGPNQGYYDVGFDLFNLAAGIYRLTLAASINAPNGTLLSQGFAYDGQTPIPIPLWNQPTYDINANDQKGTLWRLHFSGVDAVTAVPEPAAAWLMALGAAGLLLRRRIHAPAR